MFLRIVDFPVTVQAKKYVISLGYDIDDENVENLKDSSPKLTYIILKEVEDGKFDSFEEPAEDADENEKVIFKQLVSTSQVYAKGFIDGVGYAQFLASKPVEPEAANENKVVLE